MPSFLRKGLKIIARRKKHEQIYTVLVLCWSLVLVRRLQWQPISELLLGVILFGAPFTFFWLGLSYFCRWLLFDCASREAAVQFSTHHCASHFPSHDECVLSFSFVSWFHCCLD